MLLDPPTNNTEHVLPTALATLAPAQAQVSGVQVVVIVLVVVVVTALVSCVLGHSKMGARLWSQRRSSRAAAQPPPSPQNSQTIITPNTFTQSVLYVCEGMSGNVGEAMAAARDRATRYQSVQQDTTLGYPCQVTLPDGEEIHCSVASPKHNATSDSQDAEITREYIKPPPNKTLFDVEGEGPHRSCSMGVFPTHGEWGVVQQGGTHHRHSASLDARPPHPVSSVASSSSSSSSSWHSWGSGDESNQLSPIRIRKAGRFAHRAINNYVSPFTSPKNESAPQSSQEGIRHGGQHQGEFGSGPHWSSQDPNFPLTYCPSASSLAGITLVTVPCGPSSSHSPSYPSGSGASQGTPVGSSMGVQGGLALPYEQSSPSGCSATADHDSPPSYSEVIENPTLYRSVVSRPSEQRTNSGKI